MAYRRWYGTSAARTAGPAVAVGREVGARGARRARSAFHLAEAATRGAARCGEHDVTAVLGHAVVLPLVHGMEPTVPNTPP
jgi:hypothetical protein